MAKYFRKNLIQEVDFLLFEWDFFFFLYKLMLFTEGKPEKYRIFAPLIYTP